MEPSVTDLSDTLAMQDSPDNSAPPVNKPVGAEKNSTLSAEPFPAVPTCPRCGGKLTDPQGLGWCPGCGYCRSLQEDADKATVAGSASARKPSSLGLVEFFELFRRLPSWLTILVGGMGIIAAISLAANLMLPEDSLIRALWCTIQFGFGLMGILAAQIWAFVLIAPNSDHISAKDLILSARLWGMTFRRLPETQRQVWLGGWGMAAMLCAVCLVGGYSYWYQFYKPKKLADRGLIQAVADAARRKAGNKSLEESLDDFANSQDLTKKKDELKEDKEKVDTRPTVDCVIIGYTVYDVDDRGKKMVDSLVLATLRDGRISYTGVVRKGFNQRASDELVKRLTPLVQDEPLIPGLRLPAIWVKPQVFCEVHQSGLDVDGHLKEPKFRDLLNEQ